MDKQLSRVLCGCGGGLLQDCCFSRIITVLFPWFIAVEAFLFSPAVLLVLLVSFSLFLSFISQTSFFALPPFCSLCFLPPDFHRLIAISGSSALQPFPRDPASLPGRVMYEWLALTSLQAHRHSHSVLPGLLFLALSFFPSVPLPYSFLSLSSINHLSLLLLSLPGSLPLRYLLCFTVSTSISLSCLSFFITLAHGETYSCLSSSSTLRLAFYELSILV